MPTIIFIKILFLCRNKIRSHKILQTLKSVNKRILNQMFIDARTLGTRFIMVETVNLPLALLLSKQSTERVWEILAQKYNYIQMTKKFVLCCLVEYNTLLRTLLIHFVLLPQCFPNFQCSRNTTTDNVASLGEYLDHDLIFDKNSLTLQ